MTVVIIEHKSLRQSYDENIKNMSRFSFYSHMENFLINSKGENFYDKFTTYLRDEGLINIGFMGIITLISSTGALYDAFKCYTDNDTQIAFINYLENNKAMGV